MINDGPRPGRIGRVPSTNVGRVPSPDEDDALSQVMKAIKMQPPLPPPTHTPSRAFHNDPELTESMDDGPDIVPF